MKTVVSLYDNIQDARDVVEDLVDAGLNRDDISLVARDVEGQYGTYLEEGYAEAEGEEVGDAAAGGAVGGAVVGGLTGVLVGLGAFAIPGIGPVIAAGPLVAGLTGAAVGAVTGGILSALVEWGIPEEEAGYYAESVRRGSTLVAARVMEERVDDVVEIMEEYDPVDIERRVAYWRSEEDWSGYSTEADPYGADEIAAYRERRQSWEQDWSGDQMETDRYRTGMYESSMPDYRTHYQSQFATSSYGYNQFLPAYRYGHNMGMDPRYTGRTWDQIEMDARRGWEDYNEGTWEDFKDAVRHGWEQVKDTVSDEDDARFGTMADNEYERYQPSYQQHYDEYYADTDYSYDSYDSAYRYGYGLATYPRYRNSNWADIEMDARRRWDEDYEGSWEEFKDAVRHGWEEAKRAIS